MVIERDKRLTIRIAEEELAMLEALADADGLTVSDVIRTFARREYVTRFGTKKPKRR